MSFRVGAYILLFTAVSHLTGHFLLAPHLHLVYNFTSLLPQNETEKQLLELMNTYHRNVGGSNISMMDLQDGFSLCYALMFGWTGMMALLVEKTKDKLFLKRISTLYSIVLGLGLAIAIHYFFWLPVASFGSAMFCFLYYRFRGASKK